MSDKESNQFINSLCIEASAGSGKTYQLAKRFIHLLTLYLLSKKSNVSRKTCEVSNPGIDDEFLYPDSIGSIVAITFTNKAAAEMKERVILFLKKLAGIYKDSKFDKTNFNVEERDALALLVDIIKNHSDFNITTIDSFMNRILKAFAIDLKIYPDYEITFDRDEIFQLAIDDLITDPSNFNDLLNFLNSLLFLEYKGMNAEYIIRQGIEKFRDLDIPAGLLTFDDLCDKFQVTSKNLRKIKTEIENSILSHISYFERVIEHNVGIFHGNKIRKFRNLSFDKLIEKYSDFKAIVEADSLITLYRKGKSLDSLKESEFISKLKVCVSAVEKYILLKHVYETNSVAVQLRKFRQKETEIKSFLNIVDGSRIAKDVSDILLKDSGVSYAFCRLGERISHYLIDEFQDTSKEQFDAIYHLIENAVAEGGSLFIVGDKKQAIYAWRGGDYTIFDEVLGKNNLRIAQDYINTNYRSSKNVVEVNNKIFDVNNIFNNDFNDVLDNQYKNLLADKLKQAIEDIYKKSSQNNYIDSEGYVEINLREMNDDSSESIEEDFYHHEFKNILSKLLYDKKIKPSDIMILLRSKKNIDKVVEWVRKDFPEIPFITEDSLVLLNNFEIKKILLLLSAVIYSNDDSYKSALKIVGIEPAIVSEIEEDVKLLSPYEVFCKLMSLDIFDVDNNRLYFDRLLEEVLKLTESQKSLEDILEYFYNNKDITITISEDLDALKIMTIHKAKGLESHTVIIPFYDWSLYDTKNITIYDSVNISSLTQNDEYVFVKISGDLKDILPDAKEKYFEHVKTKFIESLNLMYVANTRAKENLFILGAYKLTKEGKYGKTITAANLLHMILNKIKESDNLEYPYIIGDLKSECQQDKSKEVHHNYKLKINSTFREFLKVYPENYFLNLTPTEKLLGELYHMAMSYIGKIEENDDLDSIIKNACDKASKILKYKDEIVIDLMKRTLVDLRNYYYEIDDYWNEKELVDRQGRIFRLDRLVKKGDCYYIIDFKTGEKEHKHESQLKDYMKFFNNAKGVIYYTETGEIVSVS
ncbi:hypothetical protein FHQ18_09575 [Deferribacter autotrophicus]|uniref:DNA 3'-5' helicase n=1 Tax=Deferribacter autotrophicus TaxID=500465 RepID=A0A5A8F0W1_9BACT|nr:UvrD-helicase domain-containing protein [Deferribacter autotrophicus]KAA0257289.1 hypothetical protein FHQ18_09575 [Deferribacter autotrophicus]